MPEAPRPHGVTVATGAAEAWSLRGAAAAPTDAQPHDGDAPNRIRLFGGFEVVIAGRRIQRYKGGRTRQLFQYLLAHSGRPVTKAQLIDAIWGDSKARSPEVSLKVAVCALRAVIAEAHGDGERPPAVRIVTHPGGYGLELTDTVVDVDAFEEAMAQASTCTAVGHHEEALRHYRRAVDLYTGPYLPEADESWATIRREGLQDALMHALDRLATDAQQRGDHVQAQALHHRMLAIDPCREESYRALMRCHGEAHQPTRVQHWYDTCVQQLQDRLGLEPDPATKALFYEAMSGRLARR